MDECSIRRNFGQDRSLQGCRAQAGLPCPGDMGDVISLTERRFGAAAQHPRNRFARTTFGFDLSLPQTYLAAERVDRMIEGVRWMPVSVDTIWGEGAHARWPGVIANAQVRAEALGMPLIWPDEFPSDVRRAMRAAALACEIGRGAAFVLAATRLAFCGGFDLGDPEVLAEAAAAACMPLDLCFEAADDVRRDEEIEENGHRLLAMGADDLPVLHVGRTLFGGEERIPEAMAAHAAAEARQRLARPRSA
jgi:2-hydroxychromene-2-carboxylate isomerase